VSDPEVPPSRELEAAVDPRFPARWSPRSFESEPLDEAQVASLFEAARWAPSCFNEQPWVFVYGTTPADRDRIVSCLMEGNRTWAASAPLVGVVFARKRFAMNDNPNRWGAFDSGAASISLALQAADMGLAAHFMGGFDAEAAHRALGVPAEDYEACAAFVVGRPAAADALPEALRAREAPSPRKPLAEVAIEGRLPG
jgi:nitroreductase